MQNQNRAGVKTALIAILTGVSALALYFGFQINFSILDTEDTAPPTPTQEYVISPTALQTFPTLTALPTVTSGPTPAPPAGVCWQPAKVIVGATIPLLVRVSPGGAVLPGESLYRGDLIRYRVDTAQNPQNRKNGFQYVLLDNGGVGGGSRWTALSYLEKNGLEICEG